MTSHNGRVSVRALAKVNLSLRVLGTRPDGYHELRTTFQSLALHDTLTFSPRREFVITTDDPECPTDANNLVWRAAEFLWRADKRRGVLRGVHVHIRKGIPMQSGLGGGSSDAAATLRALAAIWQTRVNGPGLQPIAHEIGADVPYFLEGGTVLGVERGDVLYPLADVPPSAVVIVRPRFGVSTRDAYAWWDGLERAPRGGRRSARRHAQGLEPWVNDLQRPVAERHAAIDRLAGRLRSLGAFHAAMSGSGSAVFGLFGTRAHALAAGDALKTAEVTVTVTATVNRRQYQRLSRLAGS